MPTVRGLFGCGDSQDLSAARGFVEEAPGAPDSRGVFGDEWHHSSGLLGAPSLGGPFVSGAVLSDLLDVLWRILHCSAGQGEGRGGLADGRPLDISARGADHLGGEYVGPHDGDRISRDLLSVVSGGS